MGYFGHTVKGVSWVGALRGFTRILTLVKTAILARILSPFQFGVFGVAMLVLSLIEILTETGINVFLVQEKDEIKKYINSAWVISIIRGAVIALLIIVSAPAVTKFFNSPDSYSLLILISLVPFLRGFINPAVVKFQKDLQFNKEFYFRSSIFLIDSLFSIILALTTKQASSLIFGLIAGVLLEIVLSFIIIKPRPSFSLDHSHFRKIISCGKWITASGIFNYLFYNGDNIVVGRILGISPLGFYQMGYKISTLPITEIADVVSKVTFPVYVKISHDLERLKKAFLKTTLIVFLVSLPFGLILFLFTKEIINLVLGDKWLLIVPLVKILAIFGVVRSVSGSTAALFLSVKKQQYVTIVTLISAIGLFTFIIPLVYKFGIEGAGLAALIGSLIAAPFYLYYSLKILKNTK